MEAQSRATFCLLGGFEHYVLSLGTESCICHRLSEGCPMVLGQEGMFFAWCYLP